MTDEIKNKIRVFDTHSTIHPDDGIDNLINSLEGAKHSEKSGEWTDLSVEWTCEDYYKKGYTADWKIKGYRWETDKEYNKRIKELEKSKEYKKRMKEEKEQKEREEYERLKKKFGDV